MSFTMQNYNKYFNVASDISIFLIIVYVFLKIETFGSGYDHYRTITSTFFS